MPNKINILPENLASKIAAGEVIQRPASVVKELLENSIDAGARKIKLIVKNGGKNFIQVIDDGCGMSEEDAIIAFQRHSTSKIKVLEDLEHIETLGFRGEALASVAAVSQVELITRTESEEVATRVTVEGITLKSVSKTRFEKGTSVTVKNLFFNTPARREFLKNDNVEFKHIYDTFVRIALAFPELSMKFINNEEVVFDLKQTNIKDRILDIFGDKLSDYLIEIILDDSKFKLSGMSLKGFIGKPDFVKRSRSEQFIFLNKRYIISRNLNFAVHQAYENLLEKSSYPFFVLFISIDPKRVDVNVHPSKLEVKFKDERGVYYLLNTSVRQALQQNNLIPSVQIVSHSDKNTKIHFQEFFKKVPEYDSQSSFDLKSHLESGVNPNQAIDLVEHFKPIFSFEDGLVESESRPELPVYYQLHNKYIIVPVEEGMMIIDQHAAHERILYEKAIACFNQTNNRSQQLLFPHTIELSAGDAIIVQSLKEDLEKLGFQLKMFGKNTLILEGVPSDIKPGHEISILQEIIDLYKENEFEQKLEPRENLAKSFACKSAVKFGDKLNQLEMKTLIDQLFMTSIPYVCPHGRPTVIKISLNELGKRFGRTS